MRLLLLSCVVPSNMVAITSEVVAIVLVCISVVIAYDAVLQHDAIAERMQRRDKMDLEKIDEGRIRVS